MTKEGGAELAFERHGPYFLGHSILCDHVSRQIACYKKIVGRACSNITENHLLCGIAPKHHGKLIEKLLATPQPLLLNGERHGVAESMPSGKPANWRSSDGDVAVKMTVTKTMQTEAGQFCRAFRQEIQGKGVERLVPGLACRTWNGRWVRL